MLTCTHAAQPTNCGSPADQLARVAALRALHERVEQTGADARNEADPGAAPDLPASFPVAGGAAYRRDHAQHQGHTDVADERATVETPVTPFERVGEKYARSLAERR